MDFLLLLPGRQRVVVEPGASELDGSEIRVSLRYAVPSASIEDGYGMLRAKPCGKPRKLDDFDVADAMRKQYEK